MKHRGSPELEHPLFRVLVLMGGSLALGCGGSAIVDGSAGGSGAAQAGGGAAQAGGGAAQGGGGTGGGDAGAPDCPLAQWDCSAISPSCLLNFVDKVRPPGCICDRTRPRTAADCAPNEDLLCLVAFATDPNPNDTNWDGQRRVQCTCVPLPTIPPYDACQNACAMAYPWLVIPNFDVGVSCDTGPSTTCDTDGHCSATPDSVLRQDGITCGCASIVLK